MNDPRLDPVPGAVIEVLGKSKSSRRRVLAVLGRDTVCYQSPVSQRIVHTTLAAWRKWAFNGHIVSRGQA